MSAQAAAMSEAPSVMIVMPAYNAAALLPRSLPAAIAAAGVDNVLVVDPGSTDNTRAVAEGLGVRVVRLDQREGPAVARNVGVHEVDCDVVLFIDSDCVAHEDVVERTREAFRDPKLVSLIGSYDDTPPEQNFFSLYMNLRHHYTHQMANRDRAGFWGGCGAVRRQVFLDVGGFDGERFPRPMIEDIELGIRLSQHGDARLDPAMHVTHLKHWSMRSVIETDIKCRAIPWTQLILETGEAPNDLNLRWSQRVSAALAPLVLAGVLFSPALYLLGGPALAALAMAPAALSIVLQWSMVRFFLRKRGPLFAAGFWLFHQVHLTYSAGVFGTLSVLHSLRRPA